MKASKNAATATPPPDDRTQRLIKAVDWASVCTAIVLIVVLVGVFFGVGALDIEETSNSPLALLRSLVMRLSAGLISVFVLFIGSYIVLRNIQKIKSEEERHELAQRLSQAVGDRLGPAVDDLRTIVYASRGIEIHEFDKIKDAYDHVAHRLLSAKESVADITWGSFTGYRTAPEQEAYENYVKAIRTVCEKGNIEYKEVSSLSDPNYFWRAVDLFGFYSYHLGYHDISMVKVPLMSYIIIDSEEVIAGFARIPGKEQPLEGITYLSVKDPTIVSFFRTNYGFIWDASEKLKEANKINTRRVAEIKRQLRIADDGPSNDVD